MSCDWLPEIEEYSHDEEWQTYWNNLYKIFVHDFKISQPDFLGLKVHHRREPMEYDKEEAFFHVTCNDFKKNQNRVPDLRRCERIRWVKAFIENYASCRDMNYTDCNDCNGIKAWIEDVHGKERAHIFLEEEQYLVVVEIRKNYCLLITAVYIEHDYTLDKYIGRYQKSKKRLT